MLLVLARARSVLKRSEFTHDADDEPPIERLDSNAKQEEPDRYLGKANGEEIQRLGDEIELERRLEVRKLNVFDVSSGAVVDLGNDYALSCNALKTGQSCFSPVPRASYQ